MVGGTWAMVWHQAMTRSFTDGWYVAEGIHQGDHLHPNARGGQLLADAWNLAQLVGV